MKHCLVGLLAALLVFPAVAKYAIVLPINPVDEVELDRARLGWMLFNDPKLSSDGTISCNSCHLLSTSGADPRPVSFGVEGRAGTRNSPTVFNVKSNYRFFWDGRAKTLSEQIEGPIHHPDEMNSSWDEIVKYVTSHPVYPQLFNELGISDIQNEDVKQTLNYFVGTLATPNAPFDLYLNGDDTAISDSAKRGWQAFQSLGCVYCHQGENIGGQLMQRIGYYGDYEANNVDTGRHNVTQRESDRLVFRVPSLRNVALTAPYFHDGGVATLDEAITIMAQLQLGIEIQPEMRKDLIAFLDSLTAPPPPVLEAITNDSP
ncbi:cytochrome c peroxidase [Vibrio sp. SCSIO 43136]|uniref:cytochrome-c peroxidase n=1 Tax=Vibrio sp. SCSIO 43136 TaxID=2819101 RepID=UPI002075E2F0|nr:cytochrome c peroxidase [Vibrio sp. SCSIO 43136]USD66169.1 c-type cytochrome [Vibrio sp. SCSIO 43136]